MARTLKQQADELITKYSMSWLKVPGVNAVGNANGRIVISFRKAATGTKTSEVAIRQQIPIRIGDVVISLQESGDFVKEAYDERNRPCQPGDSIGQYAITAGTFGAVVVTNGSRNLVFLSNNHVFADSNDASRGDSIYQPGPADGGGDSDTVAHLEKFIPIAWEDDVDPTPCPVGSIVTLTLNAIAKIFGRKTRIGVDAQPSSNLVDAAIARPTSGSIYTPTPHELVIATKWAAGEVGMKVKKVGRTTGLTEGEITQTGVTVRVGYGGSRVAIFTDQLMLTNMSAGGDSGSLVVKGNGETAVGLLFAGSSSSTIASPIKHVLDALDVAFS